MLARVLETEAMDTPEEAQSYDDMDHRAVNALLVTDLLAAAGFRSPDAIADDDEGPPPWIDVLDLGAGTALIPIELCRRTADVRVMAADLAVSMLELARLNIEIASLTHRIVLDRVDAKELHYGDDRFEGVISNSIIHHVPEPITVLREAVRVAKPGAILFFRDLLRPDDEPTLTHLVNTYAGDATAHQRQMFSDSLRAALTLEEIRNLVSQLGFSPDTVQATSDRHWTWVARK